MITPYANVNGIVREFNQLANAIGFKNLPFLNERTTFSFDNELKRLDKKLDKHIRLIKIKGSIKYIFGRDTSKDKLFKASQLKYLITLIERELQK